MQTKIYNGVLRKHVAIIHAYSRMSVLQRKIFNVLLYEANQKKELCQNTDSTSVEFVVTLDKIIKNIRYNSYNRQYLKESIDDLASLKIEWNLLKDKVPDEVSFLNLRVLHGPPTFYHDGTFNFSFHKFMLELIDVPSIYGTVELDLQSQFESRYSHSLYENCTRLVNLQKSKVVSLEIFRKIMGISEEKYPNNAELARRVINPSIEEVNDRAPFLVNMKEIKLGRRITGFEIIANNKKENIKHYNNDESGASGNLMEDIKKFFGPVQNHVVETIFKNYTIDHIIKNMEYTKKYSKKEIDGFYPIRYFISALKGNYASSKLFVQEDKLEEKNNLTSEWHTRLNELKAEQRHWERMLTISEENNENISLIETNRKILMQCEEKLTEHYAIKPNE